jgi:hypothetical protein
MKGLPTFLHKSIFPERLEQIEWMFIGLGSSLTSVKALSRSADSLSSSSSTRHQSHVKSKPSADWKNAKFSTLDCFYIFSDAQQSYGICVERLTFD